MYVINVYERYYKADCIANDIQRNAALVDLRATFDDGQLKYDVVVIFFPFHTPDDFAVTYDTVLERTIFDRRSRRSKKREAEFLKSLRQICDELAESVGGKVFWDQPLTPARLG